MSTGRARDRYKNHYDKFIPGRPKKQIPEKLRNDVIVKYEAGASVAALSRLFDLSTYYVQCILQETKTPVRQRGMVSESRRICAGCREEKDLSEFVKHRSLPNGVLSYCKPCHTKAYWKKGRGQYLDRAYGISEDEYGNLLTKQGGVCGICKNSNNGNSFHVDHCHATNEVRGLLCVKCNHGIGLFMDSIEYLKSAILYLQ